MIELPIDSSLPRIIGEAKRGSLVVLAPPGSGKTTRVPPALLLSGLLGRDHPNVIVLEPRRVAARSAAARVASERGWALGDEVGYQVRFERRFSATTRLRFVTEGILTRQLLADPFLETVGAVVLDEFHERNLNGDLALALLREVKREVRPDLIVIVMSATLEAEPVSRFLDDCPIVTVSGQAFPVSVAYRRVDRPASAEAIVPLIEELVGAGGDGGDVLVFLPGMSEIDRVCRRLEPLAKRARWRVLPLHGSLPAADQDRVFEPSECRKIIVSTNIAETSLTIEGVTTVVDSGLARIVRFDAERGIDRWELCRISRAAADQRAGRAGRTQPGRALRLWSEREHQGRDAFEQPEIERVDLCATFLSLAAWGVADPEQFQWYERPAPERLAAARRLLGLLGALEGEPARITDIGRQMLELPVHPRLARLLIAARASGRAREGATIAALLSERDIKLRATPPAGGRGGPGQRGGVASPSDVLHRLDLMETAEAQRFATGLRHEGIDPGAARQVANLRDPLLASDNRRGDRSGGAPGRSDEEEILRWLLLAYPDRVVKERGAERTAVMVGGRGARLDPESNVRDAELYLAIDARQERRAGALTVQVRIASLIRMEWLGEFFPSSLRTERQLRYDDTRERVISTARLFYHDLPLREDVGSTIDPIEAGHVLASALMPRGPSLIKANAKAALWLGRLEFVSRALPELSWPVYDDAVLGEIFGEICQGKAELEQIKSADPIPYLRSRLDRALGWALEENAPESITIPSGRAVALQYEIGRAPVLAARLQELFGWRETPRLARGRVAVLLHLLGPNGRPVQITDDLQSFWKTTYHQVRKDLRGRYPKHAWPEDPLTAQAPARGKPR